MSAEIEHASEGVKRIHCSNCGAELKYAPGSDFLICNYCDTRNEIVDAAVDIKELDLNEYLRTEAAKVPQGVVEALECSTCGAHNPFDASNVGKECMFCGGHLLTKDASKIDQIKPQAVLPFNLDQRAAIAKYREWLKGLWFAPNDLQRMQNLPDKVKGIYLPFWTFDANTRSFYRGERGIDRTVVESYATTVNGKNETRTRTKVETDWYPASGTVDHFFDDEVVVAHTVLPSQKIDALQPWNLSDIRPFHDDYLRGYLVESYDIGLEAGFAEGKKKIDASIRELVKVDIGGDRQRIHSVESEYNDLTFKHLLLPVYINAYRFKGKSYTFLVNGQTGKVIGDRPYSAAKIALLVIGILIIIALIVYFG